MDGKFNIIAAADAEVASGVAKKAAFDLAAVQACRQNPAGFGQLAVSHEVDEDAVGNVRMAPFVDDVHFTDLREVPRAGVHGADRFHFLLEGRNLLSGKGDDLAVIDAFLRHGSRRFLQRGKDGDHAVLLAPSAQNFKTDALHRVDVAVNDDAILT